MQGEIKQRHQIQPDTFQNVCERYGIRADESRRVDMKRFYNEDLLGNKLMALLAVVLMHIVELASPIAICSDNASSAELLPRIGY